ncbi:MAG TPA: SDR family NAD(P)-dependent oxidoreductase [Thermoanaerobaculia bacterium]|nr:SDR family NAD(P)-dependent oxidoreductase [Thermoanaerobaculia bacterium]
MSSGRVLITGASGALGRSVVVRFLDAGERVLAVASGEAGLAELTPLAPSDALSVRRVDLTSSAEVVGLFDDAERSSGVPPAVVHLVGGFRWGRFAEMTDGDWDYLIKLNLETTFRVFRECARRFERAGSGSVVAVASPAALEGAAGVGGYAAAKAGVVRMVESLAREIGPFGGRANVVLPGTMDTPANRAAMPGADPSKWVSTDAVAAVIHYLTTPAAAAINGSAVRVPGPTL